MLAHEIIYLENVRNDTLEIGTVYRRSMVVFSGLDVG